MRTPLIAILLTSTAVFTAAQTAPETGTRNRGDEVEIPLPITSPRAVDPLSTPLSSKEKAKLTLRNVIYPRALANRLLLTGIGELTNSPSEWPGGGEGFGMRFGYRMGSLAVRQGIELGGNTLFHTEPRYDLCQCSGFRARMAHALKRVVTARTDTGAETIAIARISADVGTPWITHQWLPESHNTIGRNFSGGLTRIGLRGFTNIVREFWPDISRKTRMPASLRNRGSDRN